jgi:formate hydrogenlyase subunit 6/NADH:ubiquinone oxidoreductase subunit I
VNSNDNEKPLGYVVDRKQIDTLLMILQKKGYSVIGPRCDEGAITYKSISSSADLPIGWKEDQHAAYYRLTKRNDEALFGFNTTPQSWKEFLRPPIEKTFQAEKNGQRYTDTTNTDKPVKYAFFGVRPCDLTAISILDTVLINGPYADTKYRQRRNSIFTVVVNCSQAGGTCFCSSMNTGPRASGQFDLAMTEILSTNRHYFLVEVGSAAGEEIIKDVPHGNAAESDLAAAENAIKNARDHMGKSVDTSDLQSLLYRNTDNKRFTETAKRCLTCTNCTMVCPTCFCTNAEDITDLTGTRAERLRKWDSCFTLEFSHIHGGSIRSSVLARYRQWLTHKFAYWKDQFGTYGCVGCGRCITWCPVGIDVTEEIQGIRKYEQTIQTTISSKESR